MSFDEALAVTRGESLSKYREQQQLRARLQKQAERYVDLPPNQWPKLSFNWDLSPDSQRFAFDGVELESFRKHYPNGLVLGHSSIEKFDLKLCHFSRRDGDQELWSLGSKSRLAYLIAYISDGNPITPPMARPTDEDGIIFSGGHHRYAIAKASGVEVLPFYVEPDNVEAIDALLRVEWNAA